MARRSSTSLNDIRVPSNAVKGLPLERLQTLNEADSSSFYDYFDSLSLEDVSDYNLGRLRFKNQGIT